MENTLLYHYCKVQTFIEKILPDKHLLLGRYTNTNDPHENMGFGSKQVNNSNQAGFYRLKAAIETDNHFNAYLASHAKLTCFSLSRISKNNEIPGYILPRMWASYGENHKGVCIEICREKMIGSNKGLFNDRLTYNRHVTYEKCLEFPEIDIDEAKKNIDKYCAGYFKKNYKKLFFQKHTDWRGENEYRVVTMSDYPYIDISKCIKSIILGLNTPEIYEKLIFNNLKGVTLKRIVFNSVNRSYDLKEILLYPGF